MRVNSYIRRYYAASAFALLAFGVLTVSFYTGSLSSVDLICLSMLFILVVLLLYKLISVHKEMEGRENKFLHKEKELASKNQQLEQDLAKKIVQLVELKNIKQELETAKKQVDGLNQEKQDLEEKITRLYNNLYLFLNKEPSLCEELAVHEGKSLTTDDKIKFIQSQVDNLHSVNKSLEKKLENESHRLNRECEKVTELGETICALQGQINRLEKEGKDYEERIEKFLGHNNELNNQIDNLRKSNSKLRKELTKKDEYAKEREALAKEVSKFKKELDRKNKELTKIKQELEKANKWIDDDSSEFNCAIVKLSETRKKLNETQEKLRESERLSSSMKEELELQQNAIVQIPVLLKYLDTLSDKEQKAKISEAIRPYDEEGYDPIASDSEEGYDSIPSELSTIGHLNAIRLYEVLKNFVVELPVHRTTSSR